MTGVLRRMRSEPPPRHDRYVDEQARAAPLRALAAVELREPPERR